MAATDRTRRAIVDALDELVESQPFESVTVKQICARAEVTRQTFYRYFADKFDAAYWRIGEQTRVVFGKLGGSVGWREAYLETFRYLEALGPSLRGLIDSDDFHSIKNTTIRTSREDFRQAYRARWGCEPPALIAYQIDRFSITASLATDDWIERGFPQGAEEFVDLFLTLIPRQLFEALEPERTGSDEAVADAGA